MYLEIKKVMVIENKKNIIDLKATSRKYFFIGKSIFLFRKKTRQIYATKFKINRITRIQTGEALK